MLNRTVRQYEHFLKSVLTLTARNVFWRASSDAELVYVLDLGWRTRKKAAEKCTRHRSWPFPKRPDRLWGPHSLLLNRQRGRLPRGYSGRDVNLNIHLHPVPTLRMSGPIHQLPHTHSWRAYDNFNFTPNAITVIKFIVIFGGECKTNGWKTHLKSQPEKLSDFESVFVKGARCSRILYSSFYLKDTGPDSEKPCFQKAAQKDNNKSSINNILHVIFPTNLYEKCALVSNESRI
jgi:hypothetical protein